MSESRLFVGVEGGASYSRLVVLNPEGCQLCEVEVAATVSPYFLGPDMAARKIDAMLMSAANKLNLPRTAFLEKLAVLGLGISGCETEASQNTLKEALHAAINEESPLNCFIAVCSDTVATALTVFHPQIGGIILISGTGSNCLLLMPSAAPSNSSTRTINLNTVTCGGWGSQLGDFGSAYWLSVEAVRHVIEADECFTRSSNACSSNCAHLDRRPLRDVIVAKFGISSLSDLFDVFGSKFSKSNVARLAADLSELAQADDALAKHLFYEAGRHLASTLVGVVHHTEKLHGKESLADFLARSKFRLEVACCGSVFKSWPSLKPGFLSVVANNSVENSLRSAYNIQEISLRRLCCSASVGAAVFASVISPANYNSPKLCIDCPLNSAVFDNICL